MNWIGRPLLMARNQVRLLTLPSERTTMAIQETPEESAAPFSYQREAGDRDAARHSRLYTITSDFLHFNTGRLADGTQILMGQQWSELVSVEFDAAGNYLRTATRDFDQSDEDELSVSTRSIQAEIGLIPGAISVKRFSLPERHIGIRDLPDHYQDVLDRPEDFNEEQRRELLEDIRQWQEAGDFVLEWDEDYYFSRDGELTSS